MTSIIYKYFGEPILPNNDQNIDINKKIKNRFYKCNFCEEKGYKYTNGNPGVSANLGVSSNLIRHLESSTHSSVLAEYHLELEKEKTTKVAHFNTPDRKRKRFNPENSPTTNKTLHELGFVANSPKYSIKSIIQKCR